MTTVLLIVTLYISVSFIINTRIRRC